MWFIFAIGTMLLWSGSDIFSKAGCADSKDKFSHLRMTVAVGLVMGVHALINLLTGSVTITADVFIRYLPISLLYIASMMLGYLGLRYIELSVSSPICNSSGAIAAIFAIIAGASLSEYPPVAYVAIAMVAAGVIGLGIVEAHEDEELRAARQEEGNFKYSKSALALTLPLLYCLLDAAGTFGDSIVLDTLDNMGIEGFEEAANTAYELTFLVAGVICFIILKSKGAKLTPKTDTPKLIGAFFETAGQLCYVYALADTEHVAFSAPIMASYCIVSAIWARIFLKEKLSLKHYICILVVIIAIVIMGILDL